MKLLVRPSDQVDPGISVKPPPSLRCCIIPWALVDYKTYHFGSILRQHFISKYFSIYHFVIDVTSPMQLYLHCSQPYVALQFTLQGFCHGTLRGEVDYIVMEGKTILFYFAKGLHKGTVSTGRLRTILIQFNALMLAELAEEMPFIAKLRERVVQLADTGHQLPALPISNMMMGVIEKIAASKLKQGALNLSLRACVLELVSLYNQALENSEYIASLPAIQHKDTLVEIYHTILYKPNIRTCKLSLFAKKYFISPVTLSRYFYELFHVHVADFVLQQVLNKAAWLLIQTDKPISEIGYELGYSSLSNFSRAFSDYHGQSPISFRKNNGNSDSFFNQ